MAGAGATKFMLARRWLGAQRRSRFSSLIGLFSVAGVGIGVASLVVATSLLNGFEGQIRDRLIGRDAHLDLLPLRTQGLDAADSIAASLPGADVRVRAAMAFVYGKAGITAGDLADGIVVMGVPQEAARLVLGTPDFVDAGAWDLRTDSLDSNRTRAGIVLGQELARRMGVLPGDEVRLLALTADQGMAGGFSAPRTLRAVVRGIFTSGMHEFDANLAYIDIAQARRLFRMGSTSSGVQVRLHDLWAASETGADLERKVPGTRSLDWLTKNANLMKWMRLEKIVVSLVLSLIVLVAAFNIASSLVMGVLEKTREIGILRAIGATRGTVMRIFVMQGMMAGVAGTAAGLILGLILCVVQAEFKVVTLPSDVYFIDHLPVRTQLLDVVVIVIGALALCFIASLFPAWRASRLQPVEALRHD